MEWIVGGHCPVWGHPEDLARQGVEVLGVQALTGIPDPRVQHAVGTEGDAAAIVVAGGGKPVEDSFGLPHLERTGGAGEHESLDAVAVGGGA